MKLLKSLIFNKKMNKDASPYTRMGSVGVSPSHMLMYQESVKKVTELTNNNSTKEVVH